MEWNLQKFLLIDTDYLTLKKERKEGARERCTDEGAEFLILTTKIFIYCK